MRSMNESWRSPNSVLYPQCVTAIWHWTRCDGNEYALCFQRWPWFQRSVSSLSLSRVLCGCGVWVCSDGNVRDDSMRCIFVRWALWFHFVRCLCVEPEMHSVAQWSTVRSYGSGSAEAVPLRIGAHHSQSLTPTAAPFTGCRWIEVSA